MEMQEHTGTLWNTARSANSNLSAEVRAQTVRMNSLVLLLTAAAIGPTTSFRKDDISLPCRS